MNTKNMMIETIEYVEQHLFEDLTLDQVAAHFHYSKFHYARLFKEVFGENIGDYQKKRRLTLAAEQLLHTDNSILKIGMEHGYQSQEAFTRIYKSYFGITPNLYRKQGWPYLNLYKNVISKGEVERLLAQEPVVFSVVHKEEFEVIGLSYHGKNNKHDVARVFNQAVKELHFELIYDKVDGLYGLDYCDGMSLRTDEFDFLAGIDIRILEELDGIVFSDQLVRRSIPEHDYAVFELTPMIEQIPEQIHHIYLSLLQNDSYQPCDNYGYEYYPHDFVPNQTGVPAYLYLPVVKSEEC